MSSTTYEKNSKTKAWELYERGVSYNNALVPNQYRVVETNTEFFIGNQWLHLPSTPAMNALPKPVFNILKRVASLFVASLTSSGATIRFEPLAYYDGSNMADPQHNAAEFANAAVSNLMEKWKFDYRVREALYDGVQTGDYCAHFWYDPDALPYGGAFGSYKGEIQMELVDGINVMFGNPNTTDVQSQPYILLIGRDTVEHLRWEAERFRKNKKHYESGTANKDRDLDAAIQPDSEYNWQTGVGGHTEAIEDNNVGKALFVYLYTKVQKEVDKLDENGDPVYEDEYDEDGNPVYEEEDGEPVLNIHGEPIPKRKPVKEIKSTVYVTKATRSAVIFENVDTGLELYPIIWGNWEKQKNQYHGRALVTGMLPNQIAINRLFASALHSIDCLAFPPTIYNADLIPKLTNGVGQVIGVHGLQPGQSVGQMIQTLEPGNMSAQVFQMMDRVVALTKDCLGATDAQLGTANPDNTSALMVLQTNSEVPLENPRANLYEWVEDMAPILLDMMGTNYGTRPVVIEREFEEPVMGPGGAPMLDPMTGMMQTQKIVRKVVEEFDFSQFKHLYFNLKIDVGATSYYSEVAMTQTLDNLRRDGTLDVIQYLERIPDKLIPRKQDLINELRGRIAEGDQENAAAGAAIPEPGSPVSMKKDRSPTQAGGLDKPLAMTGLATQAESQYEDLPNIAKKTALAQGAMRAQ